MEIIHFIQSTEVPESPTRMQSPVVNTIFSFVDRKTTQALNEKSTTATELAKLYAHVQAMPESAQKKKLVNFLFQIFYNLIFLYFGFFIWRKSVQWKW